MKIISRLTRSSIPTLLALSALAFIGSSVIGPSTRAAQLTSCGPVNISNNTDDHGALARFNENVPTQKSNGAGLLWDTMRATSSSVGATSISRTASVRNDMNLMSIY